MSAVVFLGGCGTGTPDPPEPTAPGPGRSTAGPRPVAAEPVPDCAAVVALVPATVSTDIGLESGSSPPPSPSPEGYVTTCVLAGTSSADPRLRLFLQVRIERPRTDPYRMTPLDRWFTDNAKGFVGVNCSPVTPWSTLDDGYRCESANGPDVTLFLAGRAKGTLVGLESRVGPTTGRTGVTADVSRAAATTGGEQVMAAITGTL